MYPQIYGTKIFGARFPIQKEQQLSASVKGHASVLIIRVFLLHLSASSVGLAVFKPKHITKKIIAEVTVTAKIQKQIIVNMVASCIAKTNIIEKNVTKIPVVASVVTRAMVKKQATKIMQAFSVAAAQAYRAFLRIGEFAFLGDFKTGDVIVINSSKLEVTKNGDNVLYLTREDFIRLGVGEQEIIYSDAEGERTIKMKVLWRDRWM